MNRRLLLPCVLVFLLCPAVCPGQGTAPKREPLSPGKWSKLLQGDIVFIRSRSDNAPLIAALSGVAKGDADDVFTHCGIIFRVGEELKVYEGAGRGGFLTLAEWRKAESTRKVNGVKKSEPLHNVYAMRWKTQPALAAGLGGLLEKAKALHNTGYDNGFSWSDKYAYCSELVWKAFDAGHLSFGKPPTMEKYVKAASPEDAKKITDKLDEAKGSKYRKDGYLPGESAISPEDIYKSPLLTPITDQSP